MKARDIMTPNPKVVTADEPVMKAAEIMRDLDVGAVPVVEDRSTMRLQGVITDRDVTVRCVAAGHHADCRVSDHMTKGHLATALPEDDVQTVIAQMEHERVRRIPIVSDGGRIAGIVAQADVARKFGPTEPVMVEHALERISEAAPQPG